MEKTSFSSAQKGKAKPKMELDTPERSIDPRRELFIAAAMQGILANKPGTNPIIVAQLAIEHADAVLKRINADSAN